MTTVRLTVAQALVRFLSVQHSERDGVEHRLIEGCLGIFGHGNVAGVGQALLEAELYEPGIMPYHQARNEQAMVHTAVGFARARNRLSTLACTSSVGPGATNMVTGAALATINRLPVLLLPGDVFSTHAAEPVLQQLEQPGAPDLTVNDAFRPVSRFFDRVARPEQLPAALLGAMRVLTDPVETGAVTLCLPQDVQTEAFAWPAELFARRVWHVTRPGPDPAAVARAVDALRTARRPLLVAGGGVVYSDATRALVDFAAGTGVPVAETQAGKGSLDHRHPQSVGAIGATGSTAANALARTADVVVGLGTRWSDFTTASRSAFAAKGVRFVNCNIAGFDAAKHAGLSVVADARATLEALAAGLDGWSVEDAYRAEVATLAAGWNHVVDDAFATRHTPLPAQSEIVGVVNEVCGAHGVVVCAAGSLPGDLHKLWRAIEPQGYHVEYGFSCMGYEIAGGLGVKMAAPERDVFVVVGDGSYLMMAQELVTAVQERLKIVVVLVDNHGFASIGELSRSIGSQRFGTEYRYRDRLTGRLDGDVLPLDLAANARSLGVSVVCASGVDELRDALIGARDSEGPVLVRVETDPRLTSPASEAWWDVPVAEVSRSVSTKEARRVYEAAKAAQRRLLGAEPGGDADETGDER